MAEIPQQGIETQNVLSWWQTHGLWYLKDILPQGIEPLSLPRIDFVIIYDIECICSQGNELINLVINVQNYCHLLKTDEHDFPMDKKSYDYYSNWLWSYCDILLKKMTYKKKQVNVYFNKRV